MTCLTLNKYSIIIWVSLEKGHHMVIDGEMKFSNSVNHNLWVSRKNLPFFTSSFSFIVIIWCHWPKTRPSISKLNFFLLFNKVMHEICIKWLITTMCALIYGEWLLMMINNERLITTSKRYWFERSILLCDPIYVRKWIFETFCRQYSGMFTSTQLNERRRNE